MNVLRFQKERQKGVSLYNALIYMSVIGMLFAVVMHIVPAYMDNMGLRGAFDALDNQVGITKMSKKKIKAILNKQLTVNNVRGLPMDNLVVKKEKGKLTITLNYEKRIPLVQNLSLLIDFENQYEAVSH